MSNPSDDVGKVKTGMPFLPTHTVNLAYRENKVSIPIPTFRVDSGTQPKTTSGDPMQDACDSWVQSAKDTPLATDKVEPDARLKRKAQPHDTLSVRLPIAKIRTDGGTQPRAKMCPSLVDEYAEAMLVGAKFPPVVVFSDGAKYWLADGFHRLAAAVKWDVPAIDADVRQGTQRDAVLFSVGANGTHGQRRTNEDKRRAVKTLLDDPEWKIWSSGEIARRCGVSDRFVCTVREQLSPNGSEIAQPDTRTVTRGGKTFPMNVGSIGRKPDPKPQEKWSRSDIPEATSLPGAPPGFVDDDEDPEALTPEI